MNSGDFWSMGGYGVYVWSAYGAAVVLLAGEVIHLRRRKRALLEQLRRITKAEER
jgi:heme exporter protein D